MSNKKANMITGFRIIFLVLLQAILYHKVKIEIFLTAVSITAIAFWVLPYCLTSLIFMVFKIKDDYAGELQYDDSDPTDCRFKMVFYFDPEDLVKQPTFTIKTTKSSILSFPESSLWGRDRNND